MSDLLKVKIAGVEFDNPIFVASATPSWDGIRSNMGCEAGAGAVVPKTLGPSGTWAHHPTNGRFKIVRYKNHQIGLINNELYTTMPLSDWMDHELKLAYGKGNKIICSVVALPDPEETAKNIQEIETSGLIAMWELNVSCPMPHGADKVGFQMGNDPEICYNQIVAAKKVTKLPVGIKLTPTTFDIVPMCKAAEKAGADFIVIGNSVRSFAGVDIETGVPYLPCYGGYTGPAIKPITQRHVSEAARAVKTPIIAVGGITKWEDIVEYFMIGASAVQICTSIMWGGWGVIEEMKKGIEGYMERKGIKSLEEIKGCALPYIIPIEENAKKPSKHISLDPEKCMNLKNGTCGLCKNACFYGAIQFTPRLDPKVENCDGCGLCAEVCPNKALKLV